MTSSLVGSEMYIRDRFIVNPYPPASGYGFTMNRIVQMDGTSFHAHFSHLGLSLDEMLRINHSERK
eukprot:11457976-Prorocentrum_lima.AAC.1